MSDHTGADGEGQGATPTGSGCRPSDRAAARPAPAGFHPSREAFLQKAMRFIDYIAGDGEVEITTLQGENLASVDLCKEFAAIHGCKIWDEAYSIAIGYQLDAPGGEAAQAAETGTGSAEGEHPVDEASSEVEAPDPSEIPTLKAEIERLRELTRTQGRVAYAALAECDLLYAALAESERKRVTTITPEQAALLARMLEPLARADRAIGEEPGPFRFETATGYRDLAREDLRSAGEAYRLLKTSSTPTQETSHVEI